MRWPVSANRALQMAGATEGTPHSPSPVGAKLLLTKNDSMLGQLAMRNTG